MKGIPYLWNILNTLHERPRYSQMHQADVDMIPPPNGRWIYNYIFGELSLNGYLECSIYYFLIDSAICQTLTLL
jgi:hypothetical protein